MAQDFIIRIAGEGGEGIISAGDLLMQVAVSLGAHVLTFKSFPAEIKGGYALAQVRLSHEKILSQGDGFHLLVALNQESLEVNASFFQADTLVIYDQNPTSDTFMTQQHPKHIYPVPMSDIARNQLQSYKVKNIVALGALTELFSIPRDAFEHLLHTKFAKYGQELVDLNLQALHVGAEYVRAQLIKTDGWTFPHTQKQQDVLILEGNQAIALGAAVAGCRYYGAYPITPASSIANYFSELALSLGGFVYQNEDEISALASCLGASFGGVKSFTATSGPGLSLMVELIGLAIMAEIPVVIGDIQRGGPSTGMPTKHDQSDLFLACFGAHGDAPRIVLAPSSVEENFYLIVEAFNLAEHYQTPVIFLSDASLSLRAESIPRPDISKLRILYRQTDQNSQNYLRYKNTPTGISPVSIPGLSRNSYAATGLEHDENSEPRNKVETRIKMTEKRWRKFANIEKEWHPLEQAGPKDAKLGLITWGLTQSISKEAVQRLRAQGKKVQEAYPKMLWPLPKAQLKAFLDSVDTVLIPEANYQGQFAELIQAQIGYHHKIVKYNIYTGDPFSPGQIESKLNELYASLHKTSSPTNHKDPS